MTQKKQNVGIYKLLYTPLAVSHAHKPTLLSLAPPPPPVDIGLLPTSKCGP